MRKCRHNHPLGNNRICTQCALELNERARRITRLIEERFMTPDAATRVVDAAMFGIGCEEGCVRARIEKEKLSETNFRQS